MTTEPPVVVAAPATEEEEKALEELRRARRDTAQTRQSKRQLYGALATLVTALGLAIPALVNSVGAKDAADKTDGELVASYRELRRTVKEQDALIAQNARELAALHHLSEALTEVARKCLTPAEFRSLRLPQPEAPSIPSPPSADLPATPAAAAAAAAKKEQL